MRELRFKDERQKWTISYMPVETPFGITEAAVPQVTVDGSTYQLERRPNLWMDIDTGEVVKLLFWCPLGGFEWSDK